MSVSRVPFDDVFADESGGNIKTPQSEYKPSGRFPVVDQGKALIAGYVDDEHRICGSGRSAIVFGDHTRCFKYLDHPFCMGADGVKIIRPKIEADLKYLYYYLRQINLPNAGYDRHYKYLKRTEVVLLPLPEQRRIAAILDQADALRAKRRETLAQLDSLTQSIFIEMFGDPVTNTKRLPTKPLGEISTFENGDRSGNYPSGDDIKSEGILFLSTKNITDGLLDLSRTAYISKEKFASLSRGKAQRNDLIITLRGTLGSCCVFDTEIETAFINAQMMIIRPKPECHHTYLHALLTSKQAQDQFGRISNGAAVPQLTSTQLAELQIPVPCAADQNEFARLKRALDELREKQNHAMTELDRLFASLQYRAFRGEL